MSEKNMQEPQGTEKPAESAPPESDVVTLRRGEVEGYKTQIKQAKREAAELEKRLAEFSAQSKQADEAKLKEAQNFAELEKRLNAEREKLASEIVALKRSTTIERARNALLAAGMRPGLAIDGAVSSLPSDADSEALSEWVATIQKEHPGEFGPPVVPIGAPSAGPVARQSSDPEKALKTEWEASRAKGPDAMLAVKRKIDQHMAKGGKNPLA